MSVPLDYGLAPATSPSVDAVGTTRVPVTRTFEAGGTMTEKAPKIDLNP